MSVRKRLRQLLDSGQYIVAPGAYDPLSARLVEQAGFDVVYLTGGGHSRANGLPDIGLLTLPEITHHITMAVDATSIPVIADADTGYGNAINVIRTVREFERTGVAGFHLEDQLAPKKCGHYEGKLIIPAEEMLGKIKAAVDTRTDADMVIIARTDARAVEGLDAAIERANRYLEAGADMAFVEAPQTIEELARVAREVKGPVMANIFEGGKTPAIPAAELGAMGFALGIYPSQTHRAAIFAIREVLDVLKTDGITTRIDHRLATFQQREDVVGTAAWRELEAKYLGL